MEFLQKRRWFGAFFVSGSVAIFSAYFACDQGLDPNFFKGRIRGVVRLGEKLPDQTDEIRVYALRTFPTLDVGELLESSDSGKIPLNKTDQQQEAAYEIELPLIEGGIDAVLAIWKEVDKGLNAFDIVGGYCDENSNYIPIGLTEENPTADSIVFNLDLRHVDRTARLDVRIRFEDAIPNNPILAVTFEDEDAPPLNLCNGLPDIKLLSSTEVDSIEVKRVYGKVYDVAARPTLIRFFQVIPSPLGFRELGRDTVLTVKDQTVVLDTLRISF